MIDPSMGNEVETHPMKKTAIFLSALLLSGTSLAAEDTAHGLHLSPPVRAALVQEMKSVQENMTGMLPHIAAGEWEEVAHLAQKIEGAYIMRQQLSPGQMEELHQALPPEFIELDHAFHKMAGMLSHVAQEPHVELISFYYYKLTESCIRCHSKFAQQRFPKYAPPVMPQDSHSHEPQPQHNH
jgi:hypothetical protein